MVIPITLNIAAFSTCITIIGASRSVDQVIKEKITQTHVGDSGIESMAAKDAYMFPVVGSSVLFGLYCLIKYFGKELVNKLLLGYFVFACSVPLKAVIKILAKGAVEPLD